MSRVSSVLDMTGRVELVTGAGQGVGEQVALHLASHGAAVVVNDFFRDRAQRTVEAIQAFGGPRCSWELTSPTTTPSVR